MIQPYYQDEFCTIYNADCRDVLPQLEPVDLVLTDPPYGIGLPKSKKKYGERRDLSRKATADNWDDAIPSQQCFKQIFSVSSNQIVFGANYFWEYFRSSPCYIVWDKRGNLPAVPFADTEFAWTSFQKMSKKYTVINHGFVSDAQELREHPTQKPLKLFKAILTDFAKANETILDPFMGSGTTLVAAKALGLKAIGIEIERKYCDIAVERLRQNSLIPLMEAA